MPASRRRRARQAGLSLLEFLVALGMMGIAMGAAVAFASTSLKLMRHSHLRVEVRQALRASGDSIVRDMRLAAACLPQNGTFIGLDGSNSGTADSLTIRTGFAQDDLSCVATIVNAIHTSGSDVISVDATEGFAQARLGYLRHMDGGGEFFVVAEVDSADSTITRVDGASRDYPVGSGVFAVDERTYSLETVGPGPARLMLDVSGEGTTPFALGVTGLQVRYILERGCPPCDVVDLPASAEEWWLVNQVAVTLTAETVNPIRPEDAYSETRTVIGKPRNLLP